MKKTPLTYTEFAADKDKWQRDNCKKLALLLESLPDSAHNQLEWGKTNEDHSCGTVGCALGIAAMYNTFPGLQYWINRLPLSYQACIYPVIDGHKVDDWSEAGNKFFGNIPMMYIFFDSNLSKKQVIMLLLDYHDGKII